MTAPPDPQLLVPLVDEESSGFWEGASAGKLCIQACLACGRLRHPPRPMCPWCHSTGRHWPELSGRGTLWSFVVPHPPLLPAYAALAPYNVVVVSLEEDSTIRLVGNVVPGPPAEPGGTLDPLLGAVDPATLRIGAPVHVVFGTRPAQAGTVATLPYWVLDEPVASSSAELE